ncbi:MAG: hypothetical protein SGPRY_001815 [Prymnesium sp.]
MLTSIVMAASTGFTSPTTFLLSPHTASRIDAAPQMGLSSRREALLAASLLVAMPGVHSASAEELTTKSGAVLQYTVLKSAQSGGGKPKIGDLVAIRFKGAVKASGAVFDDILESPEPYYTRLGSFNVLPAVEEVLPFMQTGDKWQLTIPGKLGFGEKGRPASPGKPRIPSNAELDFTLELVAVRSSHVPGRDEEILEAGLGDD